MELIKEIINDCEVFRRMTFYKTPDIEELNAIFDNTGLPEFKNVVDRIAPLYLGIYPISPKKGGDILELVGLIKDTDYLESGKRFNLFALLHFYAKRRQLISILSTLNDTINSDYNSIRFKPTLKETCMASSLIDILILNKYTYSQFEFDNACLLSNLATLQYIYGLGKIDIHGDYDNREIPFTLACQDGDLEKAQWMYNIGLDDEARGGRKINIHANLENPFKMACFTGNFELVKWLWNISVNLYSMRNSIPFGDRFQYRKIDLNSEDNESMFHYVLLSDNLEIIEWFWILREQEDDRVNILKLDLDLKIYSRRAVAFVLEKLIYI